MDAFPLSSDQKAALDQSFKIAQMVTAGIIGILLILFAIVSNIASVAVDAYPPENIQIIRLIFYVVAAGDLIGSYFLKYFLLQRAAVQTARADLDAARVQTITTPLLTAVIAALAGTEAAAVYGVVLFMISKSPADFYLLALLSIAGLAFFFPRKSEWESWLFSNVNP